MKNKFETSPLSSFWLHCQSDFRKISTRAAKFLLPFCTSHLCKCGFSTALAFKSKCRSRLELEPNLRLNLTKTYSNIDESCCAEASAFISLTTKCYVGARIVINTLRECYCRLVELFFVSIFNFFAEGYGEFLKLL